MGYTESYKTDYDVAYEGMVADLSLAVIVSRTCTAAVSFGKPVKNNGEHKVVTVTTGDTAALGIAIRSQATPPESPNAYPANDTIAVLLKGTIWVKVAEAVAANDPVYITATGAAFGKTAGAGIFALPGAFYETAAGANGLARVRIV